MAVTAPSSSVERDEYRRIAAAETSHWWYGSTRELLTEMLGPHLRPGGVFLDAGCGPGATGSWMADHGDVVGVDAEPLALGLYTEARPESSLCAASVDALPFADAAFDAALCVTVLYHEGVPDPGAAVAELARVVRPGGTVCLMEPGLERLRRAHDRVTHTARRFSRAGLAALASRAGLAPLRATGAYTFLAPPAAAKAVLERGRTESDLDTSPSGVGGFLARLAAVERALLRRRDLPTGLSVVTLATKP